jgi:hypothetical protein
MAVENSHPTDKLSENTLLLRRVKVGILLMLLVFSRQIFSGLPEYWPLTRWAMYAGVGNVPQQLDRYEVAVTDSAGTTHHVPYMELGFLGRNILRDAFARSPLKRDLYRTVLIDRTYFALRHAENVEIVEIEGWHLIYDVHPVLFPPVDIDDPSSSNSLGRFPAAFYAEPNHSPDPDLLFGDSLALLASAITGPNEVEQCEQLFVRTWWRTLSQPAADFHITVVLADQTGMGVARSDSPLAYERTSQWQIGSEQLDRRIIDIPCDLAVGTYDLLVGLYELETVQNLDVSYPDGTPYGKLAYLTTIEVLQAQQVSDSVTRVETALRFE